MVSSMTCHILSIYFDRTILKCKRIYRAKILFALEKDLIEELNWLNGVSLKYLKNYQIWYLPLTLGIIKIQTFKED